MHSPNTLLKVTPRPYFRTKALPSSATLINSFLSPCKGVDLMKGELYAGRLYRPYWELDTLPHTNQYYELLVVQYR